MGFKNPVNMGKLLFNIGKYNFTSQKELSHWVVGWKSKGFIKEEIEEIIELEYLKEQEDNKDFENYVFDDVEFSFIYYRKLLTKTKETESREIISIVKDLNKIREMIAKDLKGNEYVTEAVVLFDWVYLPIYVSLTNQDGKQETLTIPCLNYFEIKVLDVPLENIYFNMYELEYMGRIIFCSRDRQAVEMQRTSYNCSNEGSKVRIFKDGKEV